MSDHKMWATAGYGRFDPTRRNGLQTRRRSGSRGLAMRLQSSVARAFTAGSAAHYGRLEGNPP